MNESKTAAAILAQVRRAVVGKDEVLARVLLAILAGGHILLEDIPGVGKTTMALAFSKALGLDYNRVQFTPDVMPSDITGFTLYNKEAGRMEYQPGAVLCNLFLADELNRATSRTQSALLEAMEEGQVTVDGASHPVPRPFLVIATQNPAGASGTQPLPDSQMDRFTLALSLHAATQEKREELMPIARKYGLPEVLEACAYYFERTGRRLTFEYSLVGGVNDHPEDARRLAALAKPIHSHINLIPVNPVTERNYVQPDKKVIGNFKKELEKYGINVTIRREMGRDIDGACGQLRRRYLEKSEQGGGDEC